MLAALLPVLMLMTFGSNVQAQQLPAASQSVRGFLVNPAFERTSQTQDSRFGAAGEASTLQSAKILGFSSANEKPADEYLAELEESGRHFILSAADLSLEDKAWLVLGNASTVNPQQGMIFDASSRGSVGLHLYVDANHRYLVEFLLDSLGPGIYQVGVVGDQAQYEDPEGKLRRIQVPIHALSSGWTRIDLERIFGVGFILHAVDVLSAPNVR